MGATCHWWKVDQDDEKKLEMKEQRSVTPDDREAVPMRPAAEDPKPDESLFRDTCFSPEDLMEE